MSVVLQWCERCRSSRPKITHTAPTTSPVPTKSFAPLFSNLVANSQDPTHSPKKEPSTELQPSSNVSVAPINSAPLSRIDLPEEVSVAILGQHYSIKTKPEELWGDLLKRIYQLVGDKGFFPNEIPLDDLYICYHEKNYASFLYHHKKVKDHIDWSQINANQFSVVLKPLYQRAYLKADHQWHPTTPVAVRNADLARLSLQASLLIEAYLNGKKFESAHLKLTLKGLETFYREICPGYLKDFREEKNVNAPASTGSIAANELKWARSILSRQIEFLRFLDTKVF